MATKKIKDVALLIGYNPSGDCVYTDVVDLSDYYDGEHIWDNDTKVKKTEVIRSYALARIWLSILQLYGQCYRNMWLKNHASA